MKENETPVVKDALKQCIQLKMRRKELFFFINKTRQSKQTSEIWRDQRSLWKQKKRHSAIIEF